MSALAKYLHIGKMESELSSDWLRIFGSPRLAKVAQFYSVWVDSVLLDS